MDYFDRIYEVGGWGSEFGVNGFFEEDFGGFLRGVKLEDFFKFKKEGFLDFEFVSIKIFVLKFLMNCKEV